MDNEQSETYKDRKADVCIVVYEVYIIQYINKYFWNDTQIFYEHLNIDEYNDVKYAHEKWLKIKIMMMFKEMICGWFINLVLYFYCIFSLF